MAGMLFYLHGKPRIFHGTLTDAHIREGQPRPAPLGQLPYTHVRVAAGGTTLHGGTYTCVRHPVP